MSDQPLVGYTQKIADNGTVQLILTLPAGTISPEGVDRLRQTNLAVRLDGIGTDMVLECSVEALHELKRLYVLTALTVSRLVITNELKAISITGPDQ